jgi:uncharacterized protein (AIM24 family)
MPLHSPTLSALPQLLPTRTDGGDARGLTYRIEGELVPVLHVTLDGSRSIWFEHHILLWKDISVDVRLHSIAAGSFKRVIAGVPIFLTEAVGSGDIAFSRDGVGHVFPIHLQPGQELLVREHQFLAATEEVEFTFNRVKGAGSMLFGSSGFFIDRFTGGGHDESVLWLHGFGNVFEKVLDPGEQIDIEPGGWIYRDPSVSMEIKVMGLKSGILGGSGRLVFNRFTGPGRIGIQSLYIHWPTAD